MSNREPRITPCAWKDPHTSHLWGHTYRCPGVPKRERHNHMTRDIKAPGKCPACDAYLEGFE